MLKTSDLVADGFPNNHLLLAVELTKKDKKAKTERKKDKNTKRQRQQFDGIMMSRTDRRGNNHLLLADIPVRIDVQCLRF